MWKIVGKIKVKYIFVKLFIRVMYNLKWGIKIFMNKVNEIIYKCVVRVCVYEILFLVVFGLFIL